MLKKRIVSRCYKERGDKKRLSLKCTSSLAFNCFRMFSVWFLQRQGRVYNPLKYPKWIALKEPQRYCHPACITTPDVPGSFVQLMSLLWDTLSTMEADLQRCSSNCCLDALFLNQKKLSLGSRQRTVPRTFSTNSFCRMLISHYERAQLYLTGIFLFPFSFCFTIYGSNLRWIFK